MEKADIWMPIYIGDYLADTTRLNTEQHGAYFLLIMDYWRNGPPPDDAQVLAQITRLSPDAWSNAQAQIKQFFSIEDGCWKHKRIDAEMAEAIANRGKKQAKAKAAANARWGKDDKNASSNAPSIAQAMPDRCPSPSPSPLPIKPLTTTPLQPTLINPSGAENETARCVTAVDLSIAFRSNGIKTQPADPRLIALAEQGVTPETVAAACMEAKESQPDSLNLGYVIKIIERWAKKAAEVQVKGATVPKKADTWWMSDAGIIAKGAELSMKPNIGESMPAFRLRVQRANDNNGVAPDPRPGPVISISVAAEERKEPVRRPAGAPSLASMIKSREQA